MPGHVNEGLWSKAKAKVHSEYPNKSEDGDSFWALVTSIYEDMGGKFKKKASPSRSYLKDFVAGVDPTGATTFGYGMDDIKKSPGKRSVRKGLGMLGGAVGGALVVPSAITGLIYAGKALVGGRKGLTGGLRNIVHEFGRGAKEPFRMVMDSNRINRLFRSGAAAGKKDVSAISRMLERQGITKGVTSHISGIVPKNISKPGDFVDFIKKNPETRNYIGRLLKEKKNMALSSFLIGGGINAGSALLQYNKGMDTRGELAKRRMLSASLSTRGVK